MKAIIFFTCSVLIAGGVNSQGFFQKVVSKVAKASGTVVGKAAGAISTTDNLEEVTPYAYISTNLYPKEVKTVEMDFLPGWKEGGDMTGIMFLKKNTYGVNKIDGTVTIDGKPANYDGLGIYTVYTEKNAAPRTIEITTSKGQKTSFTMQPPADIIRLLAINNQKENISLDLTKDVTLLLDNLPKEADALLRVRLVGTTLGIRSFYELGFFKPAASITIPGFAFKHLNTTNNLRFGNSFLLVENMKSGLNHRRFLYPAVRILEKKDWAVYNCQPMDEA